MSSITNILDTTRDRRIELFIRNLDKQYDKFKDFILDGYYLKIPKVDQIPNKEYYRYKIRLPIGYETTTKYRIRLMNHVYDLYKYDCNYYFIHLLNGAVPTIELYKKFTMTIQFSFIFHMMYNVMLELKNKHVTVEIHDTVFMGLLNQFNTPDGDLKITLSPLSVKNKIMTDDHLYISLFN